jgi:hypothetical protein
MDGRLEQTAIQMARAIEDQLARELDRTTTTPGGASLYTELFVSFRRPLDCQLLSQLEWEMSELMACRLRWMKKA